MVMDTASDKLAFFTNEIENIAFQQCYVNGFLLCKATAKRRFGIFLWGSYGFANIDESNETYS